MSEQAYDTMKADVHERRQIENELQFLRESALQLRDAVGSIEGRLGGVLVPIEPSPAPEMGMVEQALVPLADELRGIRSVVDGAHGIAVSVLGRLEL